MSKLTITQDGDYSAGIEAKSDSGYRTLVYNGDLGGGTLSLKTNLEGVETPVPDSELTAATLDGNGNAIRQVTFQSSGNVIVVLDGATDPDVTVAVL